MDATMKRAAWIFAVFAAFTVVAAIVLLGPGIRERDQLLTFNGLGPVQLGMTVAEAEAALGAKFNPMNPGNGADTEGCWITSRADQIDPGITYMVRDGKIARIDASEYIRGPAPVMPSVVTERGIHLSSSVDDVKSAYGSDLVAEIHSQGDEGNFDFLYMKVLSPDGRFGHLFVTREKGLSSIGSSVTEAIDAQEGCL